jgi:hypothetical protein
VDAVRRFLATIYPALVTVVGLAALVGGLFLLLGKDSTTTLRVVGVALIVVSLLVYSFSYRIGQRFFGDTR